MDSMLQYSILAAINFTMGSLLLVTYFLLDKLTVLLLLSLYFYVMMVNNSFFLLGIFDTYALYLLTVRIIILLSCICIQVKRSWRNNGH